MKPEIGHAIFLTEDEEKEIFDFLAQEKLPQTKDGMKTLLLEIVRGEFDDVDEQPDERIGDKVREFVSRPEVQEAARVYGPALVKGLKNLITKL